MAIMDLEFAMNSKMIFHMLVLLFCVVSVSVFNVGCGKSDGHANSGTLNSYNFVYFGNLGSSTINSYFLKSDGSVTSVTNTISTGAGTSNISSLIGSPDGKFLYATNKSSNNISWRSEERRVGKECRSRWSPY